MSAISQTSPYPAAPTGLIVAWPSAAAPVGWLNCDGTAYQQSTYAALHSVIGTTYGGVQLPNAITADSPTIYWKLDETSGTSAADSSGNGNNGTYDNTPTLNQSGAVDGVTGTSVSFNGTDERTQLTTPTALRVNTSISMACWVNLSSSSLAGVFIYNGNTNVRGFGIGVGSAGSGGSFSSNGNQLIATFSGVRLIPTGYYIGTGWHHVALVINSSGKPSCYADGVLVYSDTGTNAVAPTSSSKCVTAAIFDTSTTYVNHFNGKIDEAAFFASALTQTQIISHMQAGPSGSYFRVPDLRGRGVVGKSSSTSLGNISKGITAAPSNNNTGNASHDHAHSGNSGGNSAGHTHNYLSSSPNVSATSSTESVFHTHAYTTGNQSASHTHVFTHTHRTPDVVSNYIIKF